MPVTSLLIPTKHLLDRLGSDLAQAGVPVGDYALELRIVSEGLVVTWREIEERPVREMVKLVVARA